MNYLRSGKVYIPEDDNELEELKEELDFYQIASYYELLNYREFVFRSIGDTNGILYWLGTNEGKDAWQNPITLGKVTVQCSPSWYSGDGSSLAGRSESSGGVCDTGSPNTAWFQMNLPYPV